MRDPLFWVPIKFKLPLTFVSICLVAFGVGGFVVTSTAQEALVRQIRSRLDERAAATRMIVRHHLDLVARRAEDFASDGFIRTSAEAIAAEGATPESIAVRQLREHLVASKLPLVAAFVDAAVLDMAGRRICDAYGGAEGRSVSETSFTALLEPGGSRDYPSFAVATPLRDLSGKRRIGTLVLQIRADTWVGGMNELRGLPAADGAVVAVQSGRGARLQLAGDQSPADAIAYRSTIPETGWNLIVEVDRAAVTAPAARLRNRFLATAAVLLGLTALVLFFPVRFLLAPLSRIREAARRLAGGDFSVRVGYSSKDEIGDLSRAFDIMANAIEERTEALKRREASIRLERDRLDAVLSSMRDGLLALDGNGSVTFANEAAQPLVELLDDASVAVRAGCAAPDAAGCVNCLREAVLPRGACTIKADGRVFEVHVTELPGADGESPGRLCVSRDITERVAQAKVQAHQERMNVLGNISAVMAHELNNPLAAIAMFAQMLESQLDAGEGGGGGAGGAGRGLSDEAARNAARESAEVIRRNVETCRRTIRGLLDTAGQGPPDTADFDLRDLIEDVRRFLRPIWERAGIAFDVDCAEDVGDVVGDELQLRQVLINLVMNAVHAMEDGGWVAVRARRDERGFRIEVEDTGTGIPADERDRVFEPFFTTKAPGVGTGLGLSTSRRIIAAHAGSLEIVATGAGGTTFAILLPDKNTAPDPVESARD